MQGSSFQTVRGRCRTTTKYLAKLLMSADDWTMAYYAMKGIEEGMEARQITAGHELGERHPTCTLLNIGCMFLLLDQHLEPVGRQRPHPYTVVVCTRTTATLEPQWSCCRARRLKLSAVALLLLVGSAQIAGSWTLARARKSQNILN
jgi:hypothetical protein